MKTAIVALLFAAYWVIGQAGEIIANVMEKM